jgi:hypothetical protein
MSLINDLIVLKSLLKRTKVGRMSNEGLRGYLKLSLELTKYNNEFEQKRRDLATEAVEQKGYDIQNITPEQDREVFNIIAPILDEYLGTEVPVETKVLSWNDLFDGVLNLTDNDSLTTEEKTTLTSYLCKEDL